jgi:MOSC domain-containing protein YiiM
VTGVRLVGLNVGQTANVVYHGRATTTAGAKQPVAAAWLGPDGFSGDAQADRQNHGGPDKAVCVYASEHYPFWEARLGRALPPSAFSENFTLEGLVEAEAGLGDIYAVGAAVVQVCQPRIPCFKLAGRLDDLGAPDLIHATGKSGFYLRVLTPGEVRAGDSLTLRSRHPAGISIQFVNEVIYRHNTEPASYAAILAVEAAASGLRRNVRRQQQRANEE